ncbi:MAG TPA: tetratricopeptide repeat protein [Polyangiaceae bacterium]
MTDDKKLPDGLDEIDWDQALSEWENKTFVPEVAKDVATDKPGALQGGPVSKPLYRPPVAQPPRPKPGPPPAPKVVPPKPPPAPPARPAAAAAPPAASPPVVASPPPPAVEEEEGGATLIAAIPLELLRGEEASPKSSSRGGGLGQLFARDDKREAMSVDVSFDESQPRVPAAQRPRSDPPGEVVTSAKPVAAKAPGEAMALRRPSQLDVSERVPEGAMFDPFAAPDAERAPPTPQVGPEAAQDAGDGIDDLLAQSTPPPPMSEGEPEPDTKRQDAEALPPSTTQQMPPMKPASEPPARGPALLAPEARNYDPNEETMVGGDADIARARAAVAARRLASQPPGRGVDDDEEPTGLEARTAAAIATPTRTWPDEKPASSWLSESAREALTSRAEWLEQEARSLGDKVARARGLLVCSEILATTGDRERAQGLAVEARDLAPSLPLAHRQARALMPSPPDPDDLVEALDLEVKMTPAGPARLHSTLLAAEVLRAAGDDDASVKRLDQAARILATDVRAPIARATRALGRAENASAALRLAENAELAPVGEAINLALRLRGVDRKEVAGGEPSANESLLRARQALDQGDTAAAAPLVARLADIPELSGGATWLAASLGAVRPARRADATGWLRELVERGDLEARRALTARAIEQGDSELVSEQLAAGGPLTSPERVGLAALLGLRLTPVDPHLDATAAMPAMQPLAAAAGAVSRPAEGPEHPTQLLARAHRTAGSAESKTLVCLGRLLASSAAPPTVEATLAQLDDPKPAAARAVALEMAARAERALDVSSALEAWGAARASGEERAAGALAAALIAERAGHRVRALEAYKAARAADPTNEAALRAIASLEQVDLVAEMNSLADELGDGPRGATARIEAVTRGEGLLPEPTRADLLEKAHRAAPTLPVAAFLAERIARRAGDVEDVLRWIRERRAATTDPIEMALDGVREALLVADREPGVAAERLLDAHRARPGDVALRELCERMASEALDDRAVWREQRAAEASGDTRTLLYLEAAQAYERAGDDEGALRSAEAAAATDAPLGRIARERAELRSGRVSRLADELLGSAKATEDVRERREAYERLAILDASARQDPASALLWHRSILEETPGFLPSLRHVEQHLVGEGRDDELEPIASGIALALRGTGPGETTAHAELAARLRMRGAEGSWDATREMVQLAASEGEPSLWSLRMMQAHARARGDDVEFLAITLRLLERSPRPAEAAALLARAGETASRLGNLDQARSLLERAAAEDPGDVVAWGLLTDVRQRAGDARGAAEACESLARSSLVREHQLLAWYDAGRFWSDEVQDDDRAILAFEAAAAIDVAHEDVFDRLSRIYASRKMQPELAGLLERRIEGITDPEERLAMEVRRGRILLEVGDNEGARAAFEVALAERPDDANALSAFADLCVALHDWDAAEQALVRLARLLPTPEEQRDVYARLGDLYSKHLLNLARAEVALKEVLKRAPDDVLTREKLVDVYRRQNDPARALELQQELVGKSTSVEEKRHRIIELAGIHEQVAHDTRRAEQTLEAARREFPGDMAVLRALAEFYIRHQQTPAMNILLDRAGADARRALAAGRFAPGPFGVLATVFDLRGRKDAARVTQSMLAAFEGRPVDLGGAGERAFDPHLNDVLSPDVISPAMRALLLKTGEALDVAAAIDLRALKAAPVPPDAPLARLATNVGHAIGIGPVQVLSSPKVGPTCLPVGSSPPTILLGEAMLANERTAAFVVLRAIKLVASRASAFGRTHPAELAVLVSAWLKCFNPTWQPQGINAAALNAAGGRIQAALPRNLDPDVGVIALEVAGNLGTQAATIGPMGIAWGNRTALLALGDPNAALDAIAGAAGQPAGAPRDPGERATWIGRTPEARDLVSFAVGEGFAEARVRLGFDR